MSEKKLKLLDLYCGGGGAGAGYASAGFDVTGIDIVKHKNYPYRCFQHDAIDFVNNWGHLFDFIHASPPCQKFSKSTATKRSQGKEYPDLVGPTRKALEKTGKPFIMENVMQAPIQPDIVLHGDMFGLKVIRKRKFELGNWFTLINEADKNRLCVKKGEAVIVYGNASYKPSGPGKNGDPRRTITRPEWRKDSVRKTWAYAMGIDHYMTDREIAESIPPAYTRYIGGLFLEYYKNNHKL